MIRLMLWRISKEIELAFCLEISTSICLEYGHEHFQNWFHHPPDTKQIDSNEINHKKNKN